jgi:tRNA(Ser,Leu) C12 N-acetylase TAN1
MSRWNMLLTTPPGQERTLLPALRRLGVFCRSRFHGILQGWVEDYEQFLEEIRRASAEKADWVKELLRVLPVERTFQFTPQTFEERLHEAVAAFVERMSNGTFYCRLERRGLKGRIVSPEIEQRLGEHIRALAAQHGKTLRVSFRDPDYIIVAETVGNSCGVALVTRELRTRYPFVKIR